VESSFLNVLVVFAFALLITVTGGIVYLTLADWRDRRRQDQEKRSAKKTAKRK
jgi:hypothetical protein